MKKIVIYSKQGNGISRSHQITYVFSPRFVVLDQYKLNLEDQ